MHSLDQEITYEKFKTIDNYIKKQQKYARIPGLVLIIVNGKSSSFIKKYGEFGSSFTEDFSGKYLFEAGAISNSLIGLAILQFISEGELDLNHSVAEYLPWFKMAYYPEQTNPTLNYLKHFKFVPSALKNKKTANIKIKHLLRHTSGITTPYYPYLSLNKKENDKKTIQEFMRTPLSWQPGVRYAYSNFNYIVLAWIIEAVSNKNFQDYMNNDFFNFLDLRQMFFSTDNYPGLPVLDNYKLGFLNMHRRKTRKYLSIPTADLILTPDSVRDYLEIQLGLTEKQEYEQIVRMSQEDDYFYSFGWHKINLGNKHILSHFGHTRHHSAYLEINISEQIGMGILANRNTHYIKNIGRGIINSIRNQGRIPGKSFELDKTLDVCCSILLIILILVFFLQLKLFKKIKRQRIVFFKYRLIKKGLIFYIIGLLLVFLYLFFLPQIFLFVSWEVVLTLGPLSLTAVVFFSIFLILNTAIILYLKS